MKSRLLAAAGGLVLLAGCITVTLPDLSALGSGQRSGPTVPADGDYTDFAPAGYIRLLNATPHGFRYSSAGEPVRRGEVSERFELRQGDCGGSDCPNPRYRSEIRQDPDRTRARLDEERWFGWSFYNANVASYPEAVALKTVFGQWKIDGEVPPALRIVQIGRGEGNWTACDPAICNRSSDGEKDVVLQLDDVQQARNWGPAQNFGYICQLFSIEAARGKWMDIVINTNFSPERDGFVRAWVNGEQVCNYRGPVVATVDRALRARPNHRRGIFVSYTKRWDDRRPDTPKPTMIVHYDEFLSGATREAVDTRLREVAGLPPVD